MTHFHEKANSIGLFGRMKRALTAACLSVPLLFYMASTAAGQTILASITGTVTDPSGAVVPDAQVTVTNEGTGLTRSASTSPAGVFTVPDLSVGTYRLRVEAKGFQTQERTGLILNANRVLNLDIQLMLGSAATQLQVQGRAPVINTETGTLTYTRSTRELQQLPLIELTCGSHQALGFALTNPGAYENDSGNFGANGVRYTDTMLTNDGIVEMADPDGVGGGPVQPGFEALQEVTYSLADSPAEFARPANFTLVTKSGTNQFHGTAHWLYNSNALNARHFFSDTVPFRVDNVFGASFGGPIKKDKTFFFGDYNAARESATSPVVDDTPLVPWRTGDFSGLLSQGVVITNPFTGTPFPNNQIPPNLINPVSQNAQNYFFQPPNFGPPDLQSGNWRGQFPGLTNWTHFDDFDVRVDHNFSTRDTVFTRISYRQLPTPYLTGLMPPIQFGNDVRGARMGVIAWTHTFTPTLINEARGGFSRQRNIYYTPVTGSDIISKIGIQGIQTTGLHGVPVFNITGVTSTNPCSEGLSLDTNFQWTDNVSWTRGAHSAKFGIDVIRDQIGGYGIPNDVYGTYNFTGIYTGFGYADFLLGIPQSTSRTVQAPARYLRGTMWGMYAQDQFKVTRKLTLNYGLRWELQGPYYDRFGRIFSFDPKSGSIVVPDGGVNYINPLFPTNVPIVKASQAGFPAGTLVDFPKHNIYPRLGFAYKLFGDSTVIRGGYGIYGNTTYGVIGQLGYGGPFGGSASFYNSITNGVPLFSFPDPFLPAGTLTAFESASGFNPALKTPYTQQYNLTLERQFGTVGIRAAYVGSHAVKLVYLRNINQPIPSTVPFTPSRYFYPSFANVTWGDNGGSDRYNSLQLSGFKTLGKNLIFNTAWTWAKDLTDDQDYAYVIGQVIQNQFDRKSEWAPNAWTLRHRFYANVIVDLPVGKDQRYLNHLSSPLEGVLGGWQVGLIGVAQTGPWFGPTFDGFDVSNTNNFGGRPDRIPGVSLIPPGGQSISEWFNPAAFKIPGCPDSSPGCENPANVGRFGNAPLTLIESPNFDILHLTLMKYFPLGERVRLQFRMIAMDALNHPNFGIPRADISSSGTVGRITRSAHALLGERSRQIYFGLRLEF